ncbi:MAG: hypothetical protein FWC50_15425 [Planctomycetaceae bacterium]|nr:hypothetical protein [Planctomycetaceae bacterium]
MSQDYQNTLPQQQFEEPKKKKSCCFFAALGCGCFTVLVVAAIVTGGFFVWRNIQGLAVTGANMSIIKQGIDGYCEETGKFPPSFSTDKDGKPLHSWRVLILKHIDPALYSEIRLDEPWDSDHNKQFASRMPDCFLNPSMKEPGKTNYQLIVGKKCLTDGVGSRTVEEVNESGREVIFLVEANPAVEWMKPQDLNYDDMVKNRMVAKGSDAAGLACTHNFFGFNFGLAGATLDKAYIYTDTPAVKMEVNGDQQIDFQSLCDRAVMKTDIGEYQPKNGENK